MRKILLTILLIAGCTAHAQQSSAHFCSSADKAWAPRERHIDMHHLKLSLQFEPKLYKAIGHMELAFSALRPDLDSFWLDGIHLKYNEILLDGKPIRHQITDTGIALFPDKFQRDQSHLLSIKYEARPRKGLYFTGWDDPSGQAKKQIWTQGQGIDHRHWIPYFDSQNDKFTQEVEVLIDAEFQVASNGKLVKENILADNKKQWHYQLEKPHSGYLLMLGIGHYEIVKTQVKSIQGAEIQMQQYLYPEYMPHYTYTYKHTEELMMWMEQLLQVPYPWGVYRQVPVRDFIYGAMENTSATIFGDFYIADSNTFDRNNYLYVNAHEMAHQWFGNLTTAWSSRHHWLHESFATFFHLKSNQKFVSEGAYSLERRKALMQAFAESEKNKNPLAHSEAGTGRHYMKGSLVLTQLEQYLGPELFYASLKYFLEKNAYGNVHSEDLLYAFHQVTGFDLQWFWDQWVYGYGEPELELNWKEIKQKKNHFLQIITSQKPADGMPAFRIPINIEIKGVNGISTHKIELKSEVDTFLIPIEKDEKIDFVNPDPGKYWVVKWKHISDPKKRLLTQAAHSADRLYALVSNPRYTTKELLNAFENEKVIEIKRIIASKLYKEAENMDVFKALSESKDPQILSAFLNSTNSDLWRGEIASKLLDTYYQSSDYTLKASSIIMMLRTGNKEALKYVGAYQELPELAFSNALDLLMMLHRSGIEVEKNLEKIVAFSHPKQVGSLRGQVFEYLTENQIFEQKAIEYAVQAAGHYSRGSRNAAFKYLEAAIAGGQKTEVLKYLNQHKTYWAPQWAEGIYKRLSIDY